MMKLTRFLILLIAVFTSGGISQAGTIVRFDTVLGDFDIELLDAIAPTFTANFLAYVNAGDYDDSLVHRNATIANSGVNVIQGGQFLFDGSAQVEPINYPLITSRGTVANDPSESNVAGSLSMARSMPDNASSQWFINVTDNLALDNPPAFTVFGHVIAGMDVVVAIHSLGSIHSSPRFGFQQPWFNGPMRNYTLTEFDNFVPVDGDNLVIINSVSVIPEPSSLFLCGFGLIGFLGLVAYRRHRMPLAIPCRYIEQQGDSKSRMHPDRAAWSTSDRRKGIQI